MNDRPVDPDQLLNDFRAAVARWSEILLDSAAREACEQAAELADDLDTYLTAGGVLPKAWRPSLAPTLMAMIKAGEIQATPINPSGDTTGVTDTANLQAALADEPTGNEGDDWYAPQGDEEEDDAGS